MKKLSDKVSYLESSFNPLSAEVVMIKRNNLTVFYDCGASDEAFELINNCPGDKIVVLSHFHEDHAFNALRLDIPIYCSKYTLKRIPNGVLYKQGTDFKIYDFPSFHSKGCLAIYLPNEKLLMIGDGIYPKDERYYNLSIINNQIKFLNDLNIDNILISHKKQFIYKKDIVLNFLFNLKKSFVKGENIKEV